jgi:DUF4097 and DUF4098 domain-containing protein YvlB
LPAANGIVNVADPNAPPRRIKKYGTFLPPSRNKLWENTAFMNNPRMNRLALVLALVAVAGIFTLSIARAAAPGEKLRIHKMGGEIDVAEVSSGADLETMGGDISVGKAHNEVRAHTMGGNIKIGSADSTLNVQTMGGNIEIASANGSLKAETMGGSVTAHIKGPIEQGTHEVKLSSMGGNIVLTVPKDYPMTVEVTLTFTKKNQGRYHIIDNLGLTQSTTEDWDTFHGDPRKTTTGKARIGDGRHHVSVKTINGDITIKSE